MAKAKSPKKKAKKKANGRAKKTRIRRQGDALLLTVDESIPRCKRCSSEPALPTHAKGYGSACAAETGVTRRRKPKLAKPDKPLLPSGALEKELSGSVTEPRVLPASQAVQVELARRELARRGLLQFIMRRFPIYDAGWVHVEICRRFEQFVQDVVDKKSPRLILCVPPRHGKSFVVSENGPAWVIGRHPQLQHINASYSASLAEDFSRKVQDIVRSPDYGVLFPEIKIDPRNQAISDWSIYNGGTFFPTGVGGPATGRGADILNIDDPIKNREEAESPVTRKSIWDWYTSVAMTRVMPGGGILLTQTRWHDDDLAGRLIAQMEEGKKIESETGVWPEDYDRWEVISYPAIAIQDERYRREGEALHGTRFTLASLRKLRRTMGERDFNALYQQTPTAAEGEYFKVDQFRFFTGSPPANLKVYAAADLAISKKETADYSVIIVVGVDQQGKWWLLDRRRGRWDSLRIIDELIGVYRTWKPGVIGVEAGQIEKAIGPFLQKRIEEERLPEMYVEPLPPGKRDKELRARPLQGRLSQGMVMFPQEAPWTAELVNEMLRFPNGVRDDQVDALAWIGQMLEIIVLPMKASAPKRKSWRDALNAHVAGSDRYDPMAA